MMKIKSKVNEKNKLRSYRFWEEIQNEIWNQVMREEKLQTGKGEERRLAQPRDEV